MPEENKPRNPLNDDGVNPEVDRSSKRGGLKSLITSKGPKPKKSKKDAIRAMPFDAAPVNEPKYLLSDKEAQELHDFARAAMPPEVVDRLNQEEKESTNLYLSDLAQNVKPVFDGYVEENQIGELSREDDPHRETLELIRARAGEELYQEIVTNRGKLSPEAFDRVMKLTRTQYDADDKAVAGAKAEAAAVGAAFEGGASLQDSIRQAAALNPAGDHEGVPPADESVSESPVMEEVRTSMSDLVPSDEELGARPLETPAIMGIEPAPVSQSYSLAAEAPGTKLPEAAAPVADSFAPASESAFDGNPEVEELPGRGIEVPEVPQPMETPAREMDVDALLEGYERRLAESEGNVKGLRTEVVEIGKKVDAGIDRVLTGVKEMGDKYNTNLEAKLRQAREDSKQDAAEAVEKAVKPLRADYDKISRTVNGLEKERAARASGKALVNRLESDEETAILSSVTEPAKPKRHRIYGAVAAGLLCGAGLVAALLGYDGCNKKIEDAVTPVATAVTQQKEEIKKVKEYSEEVKKNQDAENKKIYDAWKRLSESSEAGIKGLGDQFEQSLRGYGTRTKQLTDRLGAGISELDAKATKYFADIRAAQEQERKLREEADKKLKAEYEQQRNLQAEADKKIIAEQERLKAEQERMKAAEKEAAIQANSWNLYHVQKRKELETRVATVEEGNTSNWTGEFYTGIGTVAQVPGSEQESKIKPSIAYTVGADIEHKSGWGARGEAKFFGASDGTDNGSNIQIKSDTNAILVTIAPTYRFEPLKLGDKPNSTTLSTRFFAGPSLLIEDTATDGHVNARQIHDSRSDSTWGFTAGADLEFQKVIWDNVSAGFTGAYTVYPDSENVLGTAAITGYVKVKF